MKNIIIAFLLILVSCAVIAQETEDVAMSTSSSQLTNKKGMAILPASGDFALGVGAEPILDYFGNFFGKTNNNDFSFTDYTIYGKYYLSSTTAVKASVLVSNSYNVTRFFVDDDAALYIDPLSETKTIDKRNYRSNSLSIDLAYQKYRGYGRLQGFYGISVGYGYSRTVNKYQYGNTITEDNQSPTSVTNWSSGTSSSVAERTLETDGGLTRTISAGPVVGIEYFFAPKMSIGAEANLLYTHSWSTESNNKTERWENGRVREVDTEVSPGNLSRSLRTYGLGTYGNLFFYFHF